MNVQYYKAMRKYNDNYEQFIVEGYNPHNNIFFTSIITRLNNVDELVKDDDNLIIVKSGEWFYKINTIRYQEKTFKKSIKFDYKIYNMPENVYVCFIGTIFV
tara:strand:+ start:511 stop:816 length:306 start_codon:yes stop_codon:yes gene_type:complete